MKHPFVISARSPFMRRIVLCMSMVCSVSIVLGAVPPPVINYQGVVRSTGGAPLNGFYPTVFRFFDAPTGGNEIWVEVHNSSDPDECPVTVTGGLFSVPLGLDQCLHSDGSGPGVYVTLDEVFRDHATVYLEVQFASETMSPRVAIHSAAYALNASNLGGKGPSAYLDTSSTAQSKSGPLTVNAPAASTTGITASGMLAGGEFHTLSSSGYAYLGIGDTGIKSGGGAGAECRGSQFGGFFGDTDNSGRAYLGYGELGGAFLTGDPGNQPLCPAGTAVCGNGANGGYFGVFQSNDYSFCAPNTAVCGWGAVGSSFQGATGLLARGYGEAAIFTDSDDPNTNAIIASAGTGIQANGTTYGVDAQGNTAGGYFADSDSPGFTYALVGYGDYGIEAHGTVAAGRFGGGDLYANLATSAFNGIEARGKNAGGYFADSDSPAFTYALVGYGDYGIEAHGTVAAGRFGGGDLYANLATSTFNGIEASGKNAGGYFVDSGDSGWSNVGYGTYKVNGNGSVAFVQNHPLDAGKVIVYNAPEGDEVATYTRGTARLVNGEARVTLGETFAWVTNPDIGLTVHLTPRGDGAILYAESLSPTELVVRSSAGADDVAFDYLVYGLRIGFEEVSIVQEKQRESLIPSMADHRRRYERDPDLRRFSVLERFKNEAVASLGKRPLDFSRAEALKASIGEYDPEVHGPVESLFGHDGGGVFDLTTSPEPQPQSDAVGPAPRSIPRPAASPVPVLSAPHAPETGSGARNADELIPRLPIERSMTHEGAVLMPVAGEVEEGDVLVVDPAGEGLLRRGAVAADPAVVGIAVGPGVEDQVPVAVSGIVRCKVDAWFGSIEPGDLLTVSPTQGHAMRAAEPRAGTILGKALERLESGTGTMKILVMPR